MKCCVLFASPRNNGNTSSILLPFLTEMEKAGNTCEVISLYAKEIEPCRACRTCQREKKGFGCKISDDMQEIFDSVFKNDLLILATPIYSFYCTPPMKATLDRLVYGMNKFYGEEKGEALWEGKKLAIITSCGYRPEKGADLFEEGIKRYCKHSKLVYLGMLAERDLGYNTEFMTPEKRENAIAFAKKLCLSV